MRVCGGRVLVCAGGSSVRSGASVAYRHIPFCCRDSGIYPRVKKVRCGEMLIIKNTRPAYKKNRSGWLRVRIVIKK